MLLMFFGDYHHFLDGYQSGLMMDYFFLMNEWMPMEFWNEDTQEYKTRPLVLQITRNITSFMTFLIEFFREFLLGGVETIVAFSSWDWIDKNPWAELPGLPWTIVAAGVTIFAYKLSGKGLAIICWLHNDLHFNFWSMETINANFSFILVAVPLSFIFGLGLGIMALQK